MDSEGNRVSFDRQSTMCGRSDGASRDGSPAYLYILAVLSVLASVMPYLLGMDSGLKIFGLSGLAVLLAVPCLRRSPPLLARLLSGVGFLLGGFTVLVAGWLWLALHD